MAFFSTLTCTLQTIKVFGLIFFNELTLKNLARNIHFNPIPILKCLFLWGGGRGRVTPPPQAVHRLRPPALKGIEFS